MSYLQRIKAEGLQALSFDRDGRLTGLTTQAATTPATARDRTVDLKLSQADMEFIVRSMAERPGNEPMFRAIVRAYDEMDAEQDGRFKPWRQVTLGFGPLYQKLKTAFDELFRPQPQEES
jgi:hypothetical protein